PPEQRRPPDADLPVRCEDGADPGGERTRAASELELHERHEARLGRPDGPEHADMVLRREQALPVRELERRTVLERARPVRREPALDAGAAKRASSVEPL